MAARQALEQKTASMVRKADEAAAADEAGLTEKEKAELRKLTEDLKRDLNASRDELDAMVALDKAEQQLEKFRSEQMRDRTAPVWIRGRHSPCRKPWSPETLPQ